MSPKPTSSDDRGTFAGVRSFVHTAVVVVIGVVLLAALLRGGIDDAIDRMYGIADWMQALVNRLVDWVTGSLGGSTP